jgi:hypothetical protein
LLTSTTQAKKQTRNTIAFKHMKRNAKWHHAEILVLWWPAFCVCGTSVELRASPRRGRCYTTWATLPAFFALVILEIWSHFLPRLAWTTMVDCFTTPSYWLRWGLVNFLLTLNHNPPDLSSS